MKKLFVSILALTAFAACQSDFQNDVNFDAPQGGSANVGGSHTLYAEVGVGEEDTKATYGEGLVATWEENDQIALLQEHADYGTTFIRVNTLNIKDGAGTSKALFNGEISVDANAPRVYHIAYPASAVSFNTSMTQSVVVTEYNDNVGWNASGYKGQSTGYGVCTYNSTLNITIPTTQNGKWEPYMYASTSEAVNSDAIGAKVLTTLNGAIAVRAFEPDGATPKQLKQITITSSNADIAGVFSGTAQSVGNTATVTGAATDGHYTESVREENALKNLTSALTAYAATTTSVTKAMSLSFVGGEKSITISGLESIPADSDGFYTYYINVAPATLAAGTLTIEAVDTNNTATKKTLKDEITIAASQFKGAKVVWESATLNCDETTIETWYDNYGKGSAFELAGSTIYVDNVSVEGNVLAENIKALGVELNGVFHEASAQSGVLENDLAIEISGLASGYYDVQPCAKVVMNGKEETLYGPKVTKKVTTIPTVSDYYVQSSYSYNGNVQKRNDIAGDLLKVKANISDSFIASEGLVSGAKYEVYNGSTKLGEQTLGEEWKENVGYGALGQYGCYVKITLANGYSFNSQQFTTHVTGIPYSVAMQNHSDDASSGWTSYSCSYGNYFINLLKSANNNGYIISPKFVCPDNCNIAYSVAAKYYKSAGVGSGYNNAIVYVGATSNTSTANKSANEHSISGSTSTNGNGFTTVSGVITLSPSNPYMSVSHNNPKRYSLSPNGYLGVRDITINYSL